MTTYAGRTRQTQNMSSGAVSRIVHKGGAGFVESLNRLIELLGTPVSTVFLAARKDYATITFDNDAMARVTLAGMVDTTSEDRFAGSTIEDLHVAFRALMTQGVATRAQASSEQNYDVDLAIGEIEYRLRFSVIAIV